MKAKEKISKIHEMHNIAEELFLDTEKEDVLFEEIFRIYNLTSMLSSQLTVRSSDEKERDSQVYVEKKKSGFKLPFNLEFNLINVVGVCIVIFAILALAIFVYAKFFSNEIKGIILLAIPIVIIAVGEKFVRNKKENVSIVISVIGSLLMCFGVIINFAVLKNINNIGAIAIILFITIFGIYFSYKKNLTSVRITSLIGSFIITLPILFQEYSLVGVGAPVKDAMTSLSVCIMLIVIALVNALMPMKNNKQFKLTFPTYSAVIMLVFTMLINWYMNVEIYPILTLGYLVISNILFIKSCDKENFTERIIMIINNILLVTLMFLHMTIDQEILLSAIILGFMMICMYSTRKNKYIELYYANSMCMFGLFILYMESTSIFKNSLLIVICSIVFMFIGIISDSAKSTTIRRTIKYLAVIYAGVFFVFVTNANFAMGSIMYAASFIIIQQMLIDNTKAKYYKVEMKFMKYFILATLLYMTHGLVNLYVVEKIAQTAQVWYKELPFLAMAIVVQLNYMINKSVNELTINEKDDLKFILVITVINMLLGYGGSISLIITTLFGLYDLYMLLDSKVVKYYNINKTLLLQMLCAFFIIRLDEFESLSINSVGLCALIGMVAAISLIVGFAKKEKKYKTLSFALLIIVGAKILLLTTFYLGVDRRIIFTIFTVMGALIIVGVDNVQSSIDGVKNISNNVTNMVMRKGNNSEDAEKEATVSSN